ncbi:Dienelactone hydrolase endo-1,3,1,4-beta-D-glucanase [Mycena venus]|uniref:Dienelactone hydrolase endo-1,3,1,4-beta-D-glucanase n=1 Tax=Mycena venus TaxID=2733690 RepID=A0A8H6XCW7_9AGAR|nr:Dienelactone hydrolase endo-1,3,1,4-beta-D-glucanase [Mycena venus]
METIGGVQCYVGIPTVDYPKDKILLYITDVFGYSFVNCKLLVDDFARNGFKVICPDILHGDPVPADAILGAGGFDLAGWLKTHGAEYARPPLDKVLAALKADGVTSVGAVGYCYGARWVFDLAFDGAITVAAVAHPSLLSVPADLEKYVATSKAPLLINSCEVDPQFPAPSQAVADKIFADFKPGFKRPYFAGCTHGFAVRGDLNNPVVKAGKEGAFKETVEWLKEHL